MKKLSLLLIILGIIIACIPIYDQVYTWYWQNKVLESYENLDTIFLEEPENTSPGTVASVTGDGTSISTENPNTVLDPLANIPDPAIEVPTTTQTPVAAPKAIGILKIDKIKLKLPIFSGATTANMKIGVGWMKQTNAIGETGNAALAAHRSHTYGRFFNRLDEIGLDDTFTITVGDKVNRYVVFNKVVVEPDDISVLKQPRDKQIITLITCTPFITATHRLIIQAKLY